MGPTVDIGASSTGEVDLSVMRACPNRGGKVSSTGEDNNGTQASENGTQRRYMQRNQTALLVRVTYWLVAAALGAIPTFFLISGNVPSWFTLAVLVPVIALILLYEVNKRRRYH
jgi:hypothetical protein